MKTIFTIVMVCSMSFAALAGQSIQCRQINKNGSLKAKGIELHLNMTSKKTGSATVKGLKDERLSKLEVRSLNQGTAIDSSKYTTVFLTPENDDGMLDIQLQFNAIVMGQKFSNLKADYVIGSDDANPETGFSFGFDMICNSQMN